jgi:serine/threonine protein kinase
MSFTEFRDLLPEKKFPKDLVQRSIQLTLIGLAFMHENNVIHTGKCTIKSLEKQCSIFLDLSSNNILFGIEDRSIFSQIEEDEMTRPIARKVLDDRHIYFSRPLPVSTGLPVISDLGEARVGSGRHTGDIMPGIYRAPEVILDMDWDSKVDIWSIGTMVSVLSNYLVSLSSLCLICPLIKCPRFRI